MSSKSALAVFASFALSSSSVYAASEGRHDLSLSEFQSVIRTSLDDELVKIADSAPRHENDQKMDEDQLLPYQRSRCGGDDRMHRNSKTNMRRRTDVADVFSSTYSSEQVWSHLLNHTWESVEVIQHPSPFLICAHDVNDVSHLLGEGNDAELFEMASPYHGTCFMTTITSQQAHEITEHANAAVQPIVDIMKMDSGLVDKVTSSGWAVPFEGPSDALQGDVYPMQPRNHSNTMDEDDHWERIISVELVSGLCIQEEAVLLELVDDFMGAIQDMGEVGWLDREDVDEERRQLALEKSYIQGVPSLLDMFSITSLKNRELLVDNARLTFWDESFKNGIEADHSCRDMFQTMMVHTTDNNGYYDSFDLVLNPVAGLPPQAYEGSASNAACVVSLLAGLSVNPKVFSLNANVPTF